MGGICQPVSAWQMCIRDRNYDLVTGEQEVGSVLWVGDGIATIYGIEHAMYGEIVIFENGVRGCLLYTSRCV